MQMSSISALVVGISGYTYESLKQNKYLYSAFIFVAFFNSFIRIFNNAFD